MFYPIRPFTIHQNVRGYVIPNRRTLTGKKSAEYEYTSLYNSRRNRDVSVQSMTLNEFNVLLGHGIVYFTMIYCTLNWLHYRRLRESAEKNKRDDRDKNDKK